jgi:hypothetical protein
LSIVYQDAAMKHLSKPQRVSQASVLSSLCLALALALPFATGWFLLRSWPQSLLQTLAQTAHGWQANTDALNNQVIWLAAVAVLAMIPALLMAGALVRASRCLRAFARGEHFTLAAVKELRGFAALVFAAGVVGALVPTLSVLLLSALGPGPRSLVLSFGSQQLFLLLFSGVTWQIASVLARAVALAEEHAQIV